MRIGRRAGVAVVPAGPAATVSLSGPAQVEEAVSALRGWAGARGTGGIVITETAARSGAIPQ